MATATSIEIYQLLEEKLGKEEAAKVASAIEIGFEVIEKKAEAVALQKKLELKDELTKELITKAEFFSKIARLEGEIARLEEKIEGEAKSIRQEIQTVKTGLEGKIEKLNQKFNFMIILMIIALTLMNPVMAEIIKGLLRL